VKKEALLRSIPGAT